MLSIIEIATIRTKKNKNRKGEKRKRNEKTSVAHLSPTFVFKASPRASANAIVAEMQIIVANNRLHADSDLFSSAVHKDQNDRIWVASDAAMDFVIARAMDGSKLWRKTKKRGEARVIDDEEVFAAIAALTEGTADRPRCES